MPGPDPPMSREQVRDRERRALELRLEGLSQRQIADRLGVSQQMVSKVLRRVERRALRELTARVELIKARDSLLLEGIAIEALAEYRRSKRPGQSRKKVQGPDGTRRERTVQGRIGSAALLEVAMKALEQRRAIWGLAKANPPPGETFAEADDDPDVIAPPA
jgi:transcriptional regulator with XRE-family HTH domain